MAAYDVSNYIIFPSSSYNVMEGFAEVDAPILKNNIVQSLDFSAAGRMTSYSTSGLVETWKLGLTSQVNDDVKLRTTWSVDIRAPTLQELFVPATQHRRLAKDPKTGATQSVIHQRDRQSEPEPGSRPHHLGRRGPDPALGPGSQFLDGLLSHQPDGQYRHRQRRP